jgi:hypothetical protein
VGPAETVNAVLARLHAVLGGKLVGDEAIAEHWVVSMDHAGALDEVSVVPVALRDWIRPPLVEGLR